MHAIRVIRQVQTAGSILLESLPFQEGQTIEIILLPVEDNLDDLARLSESGMGFWENDVDDQVWNNGVSST